MARHHGGIAGAIDSAASYFLITSHDHPRAGRRHFMDWRSTHAFFFLAESLLNRPSGTIA
jgi:hypothetical protein